MYYTLSKKMIQMTNEVQLYVVVVTAENKKEVRTEQR